MHLEGNGFPCTTLNFSTGLNFFLNQKLGKILQQQQKSKQGRKEGSREGGRTGRKKAGEREGEGEGKKGRGVKILTILASG